MPAAPYLALMQELADDGAAETIKACCSPPRRSGEHIWWSLPDWHSLPRGQGRVSDLLEKSLYYLSVRKLVEYDEAGRRVRFLEQP